MSCNKITGAITVFLIIWLYSPQAVSGSWQINAVYSETDRTYDMTIGNGRNDGVDRVYAANGNHYMYEYTYNGGVWDRVEFGQAMGGEWEYQGVALGNPNYGSNILFTSNENTNAYTFFWNGSSFREEAAGMMGVTSFLNSKTAIGRGRNTAISYAYVANTDNDIVEFYYNGTAWVHSTIGTCGSGDAYAVAVGRGRNDADYYVYGGGADNHVYEFRYNGVSYVRADVVNSIGNINDIKVAQGRNGSTDFYVYSGNSNGLVWESFYNGSWQSNSINSSYLGGVNAIAIGDGRNDGVVRVYAATDNERVYEITWMGTYWGAPVDCGSPSAYDISALCLGQGRNTSANCLYAGSEDDTVYEYEWVTPTHTVTPTEPGTSTPGPAATATPTPTDSVTHTATPTSTCTGTTPFTVSATSTSSPSITHTSTISPTASITPTPSCSATISPSFTIPVTGTISPTSSAASTLIPTSTHTPTVARTIPAGMAVFPNPAQEQMRFTVRLQKPAEVKVSIYNINAELVATLEQTLPAGQGHMLVWDCRFVASGIYLARIYINDQEKKKIKIAVLH